MTGKLADVLMAAHTASEVAYKMVVPGGEVHVHTTVIDSHSSH